MNFLADENTPRQIIERLRREGHQIVSIQNELKRAFTVIAPGRVRIRRSI